MGNETKPSEVRWSEEIHRADKALGFIENADFSDLPILYQKEMAFAVNCLKAVRDDLR